MNDAAAAVTSRWSLRLSPPGLEHEYRVWDWPAERRRARIAIITASAVFFIFVYSDVLFFGARWPLPGLIALRASVAISGLVVWLRLRGPPRPRRFDRLMLAWVAWAALLTAVILPATRPAAWILHGFVVCTSIPVVYLLFPLPFLGALVIGIGMAVGYLAFVIATNAELTYMQGAVITISVAAANLMAAVAGRTIRQAQRTSFVQQRALDRAKREADAASQAKSDFLATVSHEIRTPLHGVLGAVQLLERGQLGEREREHVAIVRQSARGMLELVDGILDFARTDARAIRPASIAFDVRRLVGELVDGVATRVREGRLAVTLDEALPARVRGDASRVRRVLLNLVDNAIKYGDDSPIGIGVRVLSSADAGARVRFAVDNGGPPIPPELRASLFEPFVQRDQADGVRRGFGLGLAIARRDAEAMGGALVLEDGPGGRTVFAFELTLGVVNELDEAGRLPAGTPTPSEGAARARPLDILIAEDDPVSGRLATTFLRLQGHRATLVTSGPDAVAAATVERWDAILMDVRMPGFDGVEATQRIRAQPDAARARVPVVATTANAMPEDRARYLAAGMSAVVSKPIDFATLEATLAALAGDAPTPPAPEVQATSGPPDAVAPLLDEALVARFAAVLGEEATRDLMALAIETGAPLVALAVEAAGRGAGPEVARAAHRLASAAHSAAFTRLGRAAARLEDRARADASQVAGALDELLATWRDTRAAHEARAA
ncbi:MAG: response regulator [Deltaproteobacteria bacterium]|nr:response regulator [Deltaproteobacteria bacterium]